MKIKQNVSVISALILSGGFMTSGAHAAECVNPTGSGNCFATIQEAVDAADPGEKITIKRGVYKENVTIPVAKDGITLSGSSRKGTIIDPDLPNLGVGITIDAPNVTIRNLSMQNGNTDAILITSTAVGAKIERMDFFRPESDCVDVGASDVIISRTNMLACDTAIRVATGLSNVEILNNKIESCDSNCVTVNSGNLNTVIRGNRISRAEDSDGIELDGDGFVIERNVLKVNAEGLDINCNPCVLGGLIQRNTVSDNGDDGTGIEVDAVAPGLRVLSNRVDRTADEGFDVGGDGIHLERNITRYNGGDQGESGFEVTGTNHTLISNSASFSTNDGFHISGSGHTLERNKSSRTYGDGIDIDGDSITLVRNTANDSKGEGIQLRGMNHTLDNNSAKRNRVDFCDESTGLIDIGNNRFGTTGDCEVGD